MPTKEEFLKKKPRISVIASGRFGAGKSTFALGFPRLYYIGTETHGLENLYRPENKNLVNNLVEYDFLIQEPGQDIKEICEFETGKAYQLMKKAHQLFKEGKIDSFGFDNYTFFAELMWKYVDKYHKQYSQKTGNLDTRAMYGILTRLMSGLNLNYLLTFPGNLVVTCHLKQESEEKMEKKKQKDVDVVPSVLGGLRDQIEGQFGASIYLDNVIDYIVVSGKKERKVKYIAYCQKSQAFDSTILAKNVYGLPVVLENISYNKIIETINDGKNL